MGPQATRLRRNKETLRRDVSDGGGRRQGAAARDVSGCELWGTVSANALQAPVPSGGAQCHHDSLSRAQHDLTRPPDVLTRSLASLLTSSGPAWGSLPACCLFAFLSGGHDIRTGCGPLTKPTIVADSSRTPLGSSREVTIVMCARPYK